MDEQMLKSMTDEIVDELHPDRIILFGSRARGDDRAHSDIDLLVVVPDSDETRRFRRRIEGRVYRRLADFPVAKDVLVFTREEVQRWSGVAGHILEVGLREGRELYAR